MGESVAAATLFLTFYFYHKMLLLITPFSFALQLALGVITLKSYNAIILPLSFSLLPSYEAAWQSVL